jgi:phosphomannomutase/phosphoglucomutase
VGTKTLFGTSGIRGSVEELFTDQFCFDMGRAFSIFLNDHQKYGWVAIGMDPRESSPRIKKAIESGLVYEGREVYDEGATSIPSMNYILKVSKEYSGSIMVSGSHIKPHLNGVKFFAFEEEILKEHEEEIDLIYHEIKENIKYEESINNEVHQESRAHDEYVERIVSLSDKNLPKWKVVVDCGDGAQSDTMPQILKRLGFDVFEINATIQGEFFSRDTEVEGDMKELQAKVKDVGADFGVGYDSDGDRCVFVDEKGNFIPGDYTGTLIAREMPGDVVVVPVNTSQVVDKIGKEVVRTKVGSPYVVASMKENNANFGFEANGGGIFREMMSRDGGRTTIEIINILSKSNKRLSELVAELPKYYLSRSKVDYKWELKDKIIEMAKEEFAGESVDEMDGLKIWIDDNTWILFRSSMNAPEFRVFAESKSKSTSEELMNKGVQFVDKIISNG